MARRILIVDDDELVLIALRELLRSENYEVDTFSRGSEALKKLDRGRFRSIDPRHHHARNGRI